MRPGDLIEVRETWCTCQPKTTDRIVRVGRIDSVTDQSVTVDTIKTESALHTVFC